MHKAEMTSNRIILLLLGFFVDFTMSMCPNSDWTLLNDRCYLTPNEKLNWFDAASRCEGFYDWAGDTPTLVIIDSASEEVVIEGLIATHEGDRHKQAYWVGGTDLSADGTWRWMDMALIDGYDNWVEGFPSSSEKKNCLKLSKFKDRGNGKWIDFKCNKKSFFICETENYQT